MNKERLEQLTARAKEATEVASQLDQLNNADPYQSGVRISFVAWNTNDKFLSDELLKKVLAAGRLAVMAEKEARLRFLVGEPTEQHPSPTVPPNTTADSAGSSTATRQEPASIEPQIEQVARSGG